MVARVCRARDRKGWIGEVVREGRWARWDSRPEEKAKEPRGRAESERRRRAWEEGVVRGGGRGVGWVVVFVVAFSLRWRLASWDSGRAISSLRDGSSLVVLISLAVV